MVTEALSPIESLARDVRLYVMGESAATGRVPQAAQIARVLGRELRDVRDALRALAVGRVIMLAPNDGDIWAAAPFCAVPSSFRVESNGRSYWAICIWDALGIPAILGANATIHALCGDCSAPLTLEVREGTLVRDEGIVHFAVPANRWWDNMGFT